MENRVIVVHGDHGKPMEFTGKIFTFARKRVKTYEAKEARNLMRISRYYRKKNGMTVTPYELIRLV